MARIDGILNIVVQQNATDLKLGTARVPKLLRHGAPLRFLMPATSEVTLRDLLGELFDEEREAKLLEEGKLTVPYRAGGDLGEFEIRFKLRRQRVEGDADDGPATGKVEGFDVTFRREAAPMAEEGEESAPSGGRAASGGGGGAPGSPAGLQQVASPEAALVDLKLEPGPELLELLRQAVDRGASDLHLCAGEWPTLRIDGRLEALSDEPRCIPEVLLDGCLPAPVRAALAAGHSADLAISADGLGRFRINIFRSQGGLAAALRVLARTPPRLVDLQLPVALGDLADLPHGLVLLCGPTGSGKSTTLAAIAQEALRRRSVVMLTLEDPIEYTFESARTASLVRQRQIGTHVRDFATGLRDALREDPDLILIGEMRDVETITLALTAAETGHLVLASLHSRSAAGVVERIVDAYPEQRQQQVRVQLAEALKVVVAQRLLPRAGGRGRLAAVEVLRNNGNVAALIREFKTAQLTTAMQAGRAEGMIPLERCLADMVQSGQITRETAVQAANDPSSLHMYLRSS